VGPADRNRVLTSLKVAWRGLACRPVEARAAAGEVAAS